MREYKETSAIKGNKPERYVAVYARKVCTDVKRQLWGVLSISGRVVKVESALILFHILFQTPPPPQSVSDVNIGTMRNIRQPATLSERASEKI